IPPDQLQKQARRVRDELDAAGIADREAALRQQRALKRYRRMDGMTRYVWDADPVTAAILGQIADRASSPRRGGPRFVDRTRAARAKQIETDPRTTDQLASDAFTELLKQSASVDTTVLLKGPTPTVKLLVTATTLTNRRGSDHSTGGTARTEHGYLETGEPVSL